MAVPQGVVAGYALLELGSGCHKCSEGEQGVSQRPVGIREKVVVLQTLRESNRLFPQFPCCPEFSSYLIKETEPDQGLQELRGLADPLTQLPCTVVDACSFRGANTFGNKECRAQRIAQREFLLRPGRRLWKEGKYLQTLAEVCNGFCVG